MMNHFKIFGNFPETYTLHKLTETEINLLEEKNMLITMLHKHADWNADILLK